MWSEFFISPSFICKYFPPQLNNFCAQLQRQSAEKNSQRLSSLGIMGEQLMPPSPIKPRDVEMYDSAVMVRGVSEDPS